MISKVEEIISYDEETAEWAAGLSDRPHWQSVVRFMAPAELVDWLRSAETGDNDRFLEIGFRALDRSDKFIGQFGHDRNDVEHRLLISMRRKLDELRQQSASRADTDSSGGPAR